MKLTGVAISPDGSRLATGGAREVKLWDVRSGQEILNLPLPQPEAADRPPRVGNLAWSADGQRLRAALTDGSVVEWDGSRNVVK
jgi:WD40 repeat protein